MSDEAPRPGGGLWRTVKRALFIMMIAGIGLGAGVLYAVYHAMGGMAGLKPWIGAVQDPGRAAFGDKTRLNVLFLGIDYNHDSKGIQYTKNARSDTVFVMSLDRKGQSMGVVSIPRDMRVEIPGHGFDKMNSAYSYVPEGARDLTKKTVENFLGIRIDHVVVIKPYAAEHLVDAIGGVDIDVEKNMDYDDNWGNLHIHLKKGFQHLNGRQAVGYIRFRKDEEGDRGRIRRQQQLVSTLMGQLKNFETLKHIDEVKAALAKDIQTTMKPEELIDLGMLYRSFNRKNMKTAKVEGNDQLIDDQYFMVADDNQKRQVVAQLLRGVDEPRRPAEIRVAVLNGSRINGAASQFADWLKQQGYQVVRVGNADAVAKTQLLASLNDAAATGAMQKLVASRGVRAEVKRDGAPQSDADFTIVLGQNYRAQ